jgi:hypothetical protein
MYDLKKVIEANTVDDVIDYEKVMSALDNEYVNPIVAKKTDKEKLIPDVVASIVKDLGIEGNSVDDLKLYVKQMGGNTDEVKEQNVKLTLKLKELENDLNTKVETLNKYENETKAQKQTAKIKSLGIEDAEQIEFLSYKFNKLVTEDKDFDTVVAEYAKENDVKTTAKFVKDDFGNSQGSINIAEVWKEKNKAKTK